MKLVIIDDDCLVSGALKTILEASGEVTIAATGTDGTDAVRLYREHLPDILLMAIRFIVKALRSGARGYLLKQDYTNLLPALKAVASGQTVFGCEVVSKLPGLFRKTEAFDYAAAQISDRELEIITLIADGRSNKEIAAELFLSESTVRNYLSDILDKLNLRDRTQLAVFYYQHK